jgi:hypothetical protein
MPAATWRKWYPHDIEKWNSSPVIQLLSDAAYRAYHSLIMCQWESEDGYLPENDRLLQTLARVREESAWKAVRDEIKPLFSHENGRIFSQKQRAEWLRAKTVSDRKGRRSPESGESLPTVTPACGHNNNNNNRVKRPSRDKREADPRHSIFKEILGKAWKVKNSSEMTWGPGEGKQLSLLLSSNPSLTTDAFRQLLHNRHKSSVNQAERPLKWLASLPDYANGPIDRYGKPLESRDVIAFKPITVAEQLQKQRAGA